MKGLIITAKLKGLLIAEKPSVSKDIETAYKTIPNYPYDLDFTNCLGHLVGLAQPDEYCDEWAAKPWNETVLPMIPQKWKTTVIMQEQFKVVSKLLRSGKYDFVINACDAGREGELIFYNVFEKAGVDIEVKRFWASDFTPKTVIKALNDLKPASVYINLKYSAKLRAFLDWLIGFNFTRMACVKTQVRMILGRVMTATLAMIVNREKDIAHFVPKDFFELDSTFSSDSNITYTGTLCNDDEKYTIIRFNTIAEVTDIVIKLSSKATIKESKADRVVSYAPRLHNISELQKEACKCFGYTPDKTLSLAQSLYETHKILSYPRTESQYLSDNLADEITEHIKAIANVPSVTSFIPGILSNITYTSKVMHSKRYVDNTKLTDHYAIIPTTISPDLSKLSEAELNVYNLVCIRFISIFLPPHIYENLTLITNDNNYLFKTTGKRTLQKGYLELTGSKLNDRELPSVNVNDTVNQISAEGRKGQTTPPKRYDYASLITAMETAGRILTDVDLKNILMENNGLGTGATRAEIIKKLVKYGYIEENGTKKVKYLVPTALGTKIIEILNGNDIISPELTAKWEKRLKDVEDGTLNFKLFYKDMIDYINRITGDLSHLSVVKGIQDTRSNIITKCPSCGKDVVVGKKSYFCLGALKPKDEPNFDESKLCHFSIAKIIKGAAITPTHVKDLATKGITKDIAFDFGYGKKTKKKLVYDKVTKKIEYQKFSTSLCFCPKCGKNNIENNVIESSGFYRCSEYKKTCDFIVSKIISNADISHDDLKKLVNGETLTKKFKWKSGKSSNAAIHLDENFRVKFIFPEKKY